ncbi:MAG: Lrp/AsnC family transcriptional regulator [Acidimicrobiia bacterium]|nr:Lrp/AsnC family transcriptional regulator [Acidimicrobiia bacterium]
MADGRAPLDDIDRRLLAVLTTDGRISVNELARRANVSRATAYSRFDRLQQRGVIIGFRAEIDPEAVGITVTALVLVNVEQRAWKNSLTELGKLPGVDYVALTSGAFDFVLVVRVPDVGTLRDVLLVRLQGMRQVRSTQTVFVLDERHQPLDLDLLA